MDTEFEEIEVEDFGPFVGKHKLRLSNGPSLNFIKGRNEVEPRLGSNGAGKSKLLNALPWVLYGKTSDDLGSTDIKPWGRKAKTACRLTLTVWDGDKGKRHYITRTAGPPNSLTLNGNACSQEDIEQLVGMPLSVFRMAPFLGQGQPLFYDRPNSEKLEFLVGVLGLDRWDGYSDRAKHAADSTDRELQRLIGEISANKVRAEELGEQVARQKAEAAEWEEGRASRLKEAERAIKKLTKDVEDIACTHGEVDVKLDEAAHTLKLDIDSLRKLVDAAHKAELHSRDVTSRAVQVEREYERAKAELTALRDKKQCPKCGQAIKRESRYLENLEAAEDAVRSYAKQVNSSARADAAAASKAAAAAAQRFDQSLDKLRAKIEKLTGEEVALRREKDKLELELARAKRDREQYETDENPHRGRLAELRKAHKRALDDEIKLDKERGTLEVQLEHTRYWVKGFKDVRLYVLEDVLEELELATNNMLDAIGLIGWEVRYAVERETKSGTTQRGLITTVLSPRHSGDVKWKSWSGGEGQRLRIAGALALSEVLLARAGVECNIEVLDEPTRHLSSEGVDDLCEFLADRARTLKKSIYLVDHMAIESTRFSRTVTVVKTDKGSSIIGG